MLGTRADGWLDAAAVGLTALTVLLAVSIVAVRRGRTRFHRRMQLCLAAFAAVVVVMLEWRFRMVGWRHLAEASRFFPLGVDVALGIHIFCAVAMVVGWVGALTVGVRGWENGALRVTHLVKHRRWGWFAAWSTLATTVTAWVFYVVAFVF